MINYCTYCEKETNDTIEICIKCIETLLTSVSSLEQRIGELECQIKTKQSLKPIFKPKNPMLEKIFQQCDSATKRMLDIGRRVQEYKKPDTISEEK
tara:strand:- start:7792 stop:8079 length:288 start_codon:yes stop_codon:yes gene_type:complete